MQQKDDAKVLKFIRIWNIFILAGAFFFIVLKILPEFAELSDNNKNVMIVLISLVFLTSMNVIYSFVMNKVGHAKLQIAML